MRKVTLSVFPLAESAEGLGYNALLLALSSTPEEEKALKDAIGSLGMNCVATHVGGKTDGDFQPKLVRAIIGAALNSGLVEKNERAIHALLHASDEAKKGLLVSTSSSASLSVKVGIVRNEHWVAVAMFGESSMHTFSSHQRAGLGVMHLP